MRCAGQRLVGVALVAALLGCGSDPDSTVVVKVKSTPSMPPVYQLRATLTLAETTAPVVEYFPASPSTDPLRFDAVFALSLPRSRSGLLSIAIDALDAASNVVASGDGAASIRVGGRVDLTIQLGPPSTTSRDGGAQDAGEVEAGTTVVDGQDGPDRGFDLAPTDLAPATQEAGEDRRDGSMSDVPPDMPSPGTGGTIGLDGPAPGTGGAGGATGTGGAAGGTGAGGAGGAGGTGGTTTADADPGPVVDAGASDARDANATPDTWDATDLGSPDAMVGTDADAGDVREVDVPDNLCVGAPPCPSVSNCQVQPTCDPATGQCTAPGRCSVCGNSILEFSEQCDDGNADSGDHCSSTCKTEYCGDGIIQSEALASLSLVYLARTCGLSIAQDIWVKFNGVEVAREAVKQTCDCEPGIATLWVTDPDLLALGHNGTNVVEVHTQAEISWAVAHYESPTGPGDIFLIDYGHSGAAQYRRPNLCTNGSQQGGEVGTSMMLSGAEQCDDGNNNGTPGAPCTTACNRI